MKPDELPTSMFSDEPSRSPRVEVSVAQVQRLIASQFPQWGHLPVRPVEPGGWDNRTFHLGESMSVRMPSAERYVAQVEKEHRWLPQVAPYLPQRIPRPLAMGDPGQGYPWVWSVYEWLAGDTADTAARGDRVRIAGELAEFLGALHAVDLPGDIPLAGAHNFYRGGELAVYDGETRAALDQLGAQVENGILRDLWEAALKTHWVPKPVWLHGDLSPTNLLVKEGRLSAVIDFGGLGVGDPACDLTIAWTYFSGESRRTFEDGLEVDEETWLRAKAWGVWKSLITLGDDEVGEEKAREAHRVLGEILGN